MKNRLLERRSAPRSQVLATHLPGVLICSGVLVVAALLPSYHNPPFELCTLKCWFEFPCPFCGSSRTFAAAAKGDFDWALRNSPMAVLLYGATWVGLLWNLGGVLTRSQWLPGAWLKRPVLTMRKVLWALFILVSANYAYRLMNGLY